MNMSSKLLNAANNGNVQKKELDPEEKQFGLQTENDSITYDKQPQKGHKRQRSNHDIPDAPLNVVKASFEKFAEPQTKGLSIQNSEDALALINSYANQDAS